MMGQRAARLLRASALLVAACSASIASAQIARSGAGLGSKPGVQASGNAQLNEALVRLGTDPQDVGALLDASNAALQLGDIEAAIGFLTRADTVSPGNPRVKALIGSALVRNENPYDAIGFFDQAEASGADVAQLASDRGLAFDLVGDQISAQSFYKIAMAKTPGDEVTRRYALSLAVSGDRRMADSVLSPLIQRQDPAAWRTRTFILALSGQEEEAISVAKAMMPPSLADGIAPYLRYMPRLTPAQQIAAATFGKFPRAADIGRDDPRVARFAQAAPRRFAEPAPANAVSSVVATKDSKGKSGAKAKERAVETDRRRPGVAEAPVRTAAATAPVRAAPAATQAPQNPPLAATPVTTQAATQAPTQVAAAPQKLGVIPPVAQPSATAAATVAPLPQPVKSPEPVQRVAAAPVAPAPSAPAASAPVDFSSAFGNFRPPVEEKTTSVAAVDISRLPPRPRAAEPVRAEPRTAEAKPAETKTAEPRTAASRTAAARNGEASATRAARGQRPDGPTDVSRTSDRAPPRATANETASSPAGAARKDAKTAAKDAKAAKTDAKAGKSAKAPKAPANPSRVWVQLSTGGNREALPNDWRRIVRSAPDVLRGKKAYVTAWRSNFRLLTGPFADDAAARTFVNQLRRADVGAFAWTSPEGQAVDALATGR